MHVLLIPSAANQPLKLQLDRHGRLIAAPSFLDSICREAIEIADAGTILVIGPYERGRYSVPMAVGGLGAGISLGTFVVPAAQGGSVAVVLATLAAVLAVLIKCSSSEHVLIQVGIKGRTFTMAVRREDLASLRAAAPRAECSYAEIEMDRVTLSAGEIIRLKAVQTGAWLAAIALVALYLLLLEKILLPPADQTVSELARRAGQAVQVLWLGASAFVVIAIAVLGRRLVTDLLGMIRSRSE